MDKNRESGQGAVLPHKRPGSPGGVRPRVYPFPSVLLPESLAGEKGSRLHLRPPRRRVSPECHPSAVLLPESVTPSAGPHGAAFPRTSSGLFSCPSGGNYYTQFADRWQAEIPRAGGFRLFKRNPSPSVGAFSAFLRRLAAPHFYWTPSKFHRREVFKKVLTNSGLSGYNR